MKKMILITSAILFSALSFAETGSFGNMTWNLDSNGTLTINGTGDMPTGVVHPWPDREQQEKIKNVIISEGITSVSHDLFNFGFYNNIQSVQLPNTLKKIEDAAFVACKFSSIIIPENVTYIGGIGIAKAAVDTLYYNAKKCVLGGDQDMGPSTVFFGKEVTRIPDGLFDLYYLKKIIVPWTDPSTIIVGENLFKGLKKADCKLIVPNGTSAKYASSQDWKDFNIIEESNNDKISWSFENGTLIISGQGDMPDYTHNSNLPWASVYNSINSIVIEEGITRIGNYPFSGCPLTNLVIPESAKSIGYAAFNATNLEIITIPKGITSIEDFAFAHNLYLKKIIVNWDVPLNINDAVFAASFPDYNSQNCLLIVPTGTKSLYQQANVWRSFTIIEQINSEITPDAIFSWQPTENATGYQLIIYADVEHTNIICTINFDVLGNYISTVFPVKSKVARTEIPFSYPLENLLNNTTYYYSITAFDGTEIIAQQNGLFTTEDDGTGIVDTQLSGIKIYTDNKTVVIEDVLGEDIFIYTIQGKLVASFKAIANVVEIPVQQTGVYIVRINGNVQKVIVN